MRILFTGASSFTGFWFVEALSAAGHDVVCPVTGALDGYQGARKLRVSRLQSRCRLVSQTPFGSDAFLELIRGSGPWDLLCHHAADVTDYKSPDFDLHRALLNNVRQLRTVLAALKPAGLQSLIFTGSVFENDEGIGEEPRRAFSPYGLSKGLTWQVFRYYCGEAGVPLGKFVIPNPFGPFEEPRFTAYLMQCWSRSQLAEVKTPDYVRDNIHVDLLAQVYRRFVEQVAAKREPLTRINPSGYPESQGQFTQRVAQEVRARTNWACELKLATQTDFKEPLRRVNSEPAAAKVPEWNERAAWDAFVEFYRGK